jgi:hypothetical protein
MIWLMLLLLPYFVWVLYVLVMGFYRAHLRQGLNRLTLALALPWLVIGYAADWLLNWTWAVLVFDELPRSAKELVTDRLQRYMRPAGPDAQGQTYRYRRAKLICDTFLHPFDENHCN